MNESREGDAEEAMDGSPEDDARRTEELLRLLDHPGPRVEADDVIRRARGPGDRPRRFALAASLIGLFAAVGAAAALPGSPLREWIERTLDHEPAAPQSVPAPAAQSSPETPQGPGVEFVPGGPVEILFDAGQDIGRLRVRRVGGERVSIHSIGGSAGFSIGSDRVEVENRGSTADFEILIPQHLSSMRVEIDGLTVFELVDGVVLVPESTPDGTLEAGLLIGLSGMPGPG